VIQPPLLWLGLGSTKSTALTNGSVEAADITPLKMGALEGTIGYTSDPLPIHL
jgi:hypothetical protein